MTIAEIIAHPRLVSFEKVNREDPRYRYFRFVIIRPDDRRWMIERDDLNEAIRDTSSMIQLDRIPIEEHAVEAPKFFQGDDYQDDELDDFFAD